ncbi:MAG: hypothetical protein WDO74_13770 [Pseudomonadota bacterium]
MRIALRAIDDDAKRLASGLKREVRGAALAALELATQAYPVREVAARIHCFHPFGGVRLGPRRARGFWQSRTRTRARISAFLAAS